MKDVSNRKEIIIIGVLLLLVLVMLGVSYAAFRFTGAGTKLNTITTGSITMSYTESDNTITLTGALPTTDETGKKRLNPGEYFDFTVSSTIVGDVNINYEISAKEVGKGTIDGKYIKLYLTRIKEDGTEEELMAPEVYNEESTSNDYTGRPANEMSLYTSSMSSSESNKYRLRMYVDESYNPQDDGGGLQFSVQINVYGKDGDKPLSAGETVIENLTSGDTFDDGIDTFITGEDPNNYIWYSGKLWRAVSVANETKTTKLVTQWNISAINYNSSNQTNFEGSYMEDWLNDTTVDGFLGNLREPEKFIVMDSVWDATMDDRDLGSIERQNGTTTVTDAVGLLNMYEYQVASTGYIMENEWGYIYSTGYLDNGLYWWTLTPYSVSYVRNISEGTANYDNPTEANGVRPSINLKSSVYIVDGDGTADNPYRLNGDNDIDFAGTLLSSRYSGEYIRFGNEKNNLYRIVSHENGIGTKITSAEPLKENGTFKSLAFGSNTTYSSTNTIGAFLNGEYLTSYVDSAYSNMIEESTTWYLGTVGSGTSYKLAKYTDSNMSSTVSTTTNAKVGLLRHGELMAGQFERYSVNESYTGLTVSYWTLTPSSSSYIRSVDSGGNVYGYTPSDSYAIRPSLNLKSNVIITGGDGTKNNPFTLALQ